MKLCLIWNDLCFIKASFKTQCKSEPCALGRIACSLEGILETPILHWLRWKHSQHNKACNNHISQKPLDGILRVRNSIDQSWLSLPIPLMQSVLLFMYKCYIVSLKEQLAKTGIPEQIVMWWFPAAY